MKEINLTINPDVIDQVIVRVMEKIDVRLSDPSFPNDARFNWDSGEGEGAVLMRSVLRFSGVQKLVGDEWQLQFVWSTEEQEQ